MRRRFAETDERTTNLTEQNPHQNSIFLLPAIHFAYLSEIPVENKNQMTFKRKKQNPTKIRQLSEEEAKSRKEIKILEVSEDGF